jgi:hypothetical protein
MLTIFTIPKPFHGHIDIIQRNAIQSWTRLRPACEIVLCGDDAGVEEIAAEFKAKHIRNIARNEYGTPLLNSVFDQVQETASHRLLCYLNADIILLSDFMKAVGRIRFQRFLMVGQRANIILEAPCDFESPDWEERLRGHVFEHGVIAPPIYIDYFVFPRDNALTELPPFAVGRPGWDNWFVYHARKLGIPVIDATRAVTVIHQTHDYSHVPQRRGNLWDGPEADRNRELVGGWQHTFSILDATYVMTSKALLRALGYKYLLRRLQTLPVLVPAMKPIALIQNAAGGALRLVLIKTRSLLRRLPLLSGTK